MTFASREGLALEEDVPLAPRTTLELGGRARYFVTALSDRDVEDALALARARQLGAWALGSGSNVVVPDAGVDGVVIAMATHGIQMRRDGADVLVDAAAGEPWDALVVKSLPVNIVSAPPTEISKDARGLSQEHF